jgi:replicative DNA helicase
MLEQAFRSIIDIGNTIDKQELLENFTAFNRSSISYEQEAYKKLYLRIRSHYSKYSDLPCLDKLVDFFKEEPGCEDVMVALEKIKVEKPYIGGNYKDTLDKIHDSQNMEKFSDLMTATQEIAFNGKKIGKETKKGLIEASTNFSMGIRELLSTNQLFKTEAQIRESREVSEEKTTYKHREENKQDILGIYTGFPCIDDYLGGLKLTELMIVGASPGQCKTTLTVNLLYNAVYCGWNAAFFTLEMSFEEIRRMFYVLHTTNIYVWRGTKYEHLVGKVLYDDVELGNLTPELKEFYFAALDDFENNEFYGKLYIKQPDTTVYTVDDINIKCLEINSELRSRHHEILDIIGIDYLRLVDPQKGISKNNPKEALDSMIKGIKRFLLTFNNGQGLRCITPHQINREGYKRACANGGMYMYTDLADTSEMEKTADVIITLFMDEVMRKSGVLKCCNLKSRRKKPFDPFEMCTTLENKHIFPMATKASDFELSSEMKVELV